MPLLAQHKPKILVAPLDWGLGHTTRCFPVIYELQKNNVEVLLAGNEIQKIILQKEFPRCKFIYLKGYDIQYSSTGKELYTKMMQQVPAILKAIKNERRWLQEIAEKYSIDAVISDNRYGLYHQKIPCIFITHQLLIKNHLGKFVERILQKINYQKINRFSKCWIPDYDNLPNLAGDLSHPEKKPELPIEYIGPLSRMKKMQEGFVKNHLLIIISGPEPQRTIFENIILEQISHYPFTATIVRGLPSEKEQLHIAKNTSIHNHLDKEDLNKEMCKAEYIICRSGYSSVMDIYAVGAKSILVPTPGQTEQEYLAAFLMKNNFAISCAQATFNLQEMINRAKEFVYKKPLRSNETLLPSSVQAFLMEINPGL